MDKVYVEQGSQAFPAQVSLAAGNEFLSKTLCYRRPAKMWMTSSNFVDQVLSFQVFLLSNTGENKHQDLTLF
jgi:hypothetical protein